MKTISIDITKFNKSNESNFIYIDIIEIYKYLIELLNPSAQLEPENETNFD